MRVDTIMRHQSIKLIAIFNNPANLLPEDFASLPFPLRPLPIVVLRIQPHDIEEIDIKMAENHRVSVEQSILEMGAVMFATIIQMACP